MSQELAIPAHRFRETVSPAERLELLYDQTHQRLFRLGCRMTGDPDAALDLIQETFLRAAARPAAVPAAGSAAEAWLVRVLINLCRDQYRKQAVRSRTAERIPAGAAAADPEAAAVARDLVQAALAALAPQRRAVIALCELEELPVREAARLLGVTEVTVRWHLAVGRREMAARLGGRRS